MTSTPSNVINYQEIFSSINGETTQAGKPCTFIRFYGCDVGCSYCIGVKKGRHIPRVIMSREPNKKIFDVKVGDILMTLDDNGNHVETTVTDVMSRTAPEHYGIKIEGKKEIFATPEHPFMTQRGWVRADQLTTSDEIIHITPNEKISLHYHNGLKVEAIRHYKRDIKVYNFSCYPYNTYLVDYMLVHNCDEPQLKSGYKRNSIASIVKKVISLGVPYVCITGGEPLMQNHTLYPLIYDLMYNNFEVAIETSGCYPLLEEPYKRSYKYVMDIKCPSSGVSEKNIMENMFKLQHCDELKFVIADREDYEFAKNIINSYQIISEVTFSPMVVNNQFSVGSDLVKWVLQDKLYKVRIIPQLHTILGVK